MKEQHITLFCAMRGEEKVVFPSLSLSCDIEERKMHFIAKKTVSGHSISSINSCI